MKKIKLVVVNENAFGYILPECMDYVQLLHGSILRGYTGNGWDSILVKGKQVRLATVKDFEDYRIEPTQYMNRLDEYEMHNESAPEMGHFY